MAMRYNTWNLGGSAGGKQMEMVDAVPGVPKVVLYLETIFITFDYNTFLGPIGGQSSIVKGYEQGGKEGTSEEARENGEKEGQKTEEEEEA